MSWQCQKSLKLVSRNGNHIKTGLRPEPCGGGAMQAEGFNLSPPLWQHPGRDKPGWKRQATRLQAHWDLWCDTKHNLMFRPSARPLGGSNGINFLIHGHSGQRGQLHVPPADGCHKLWPPHPFRLMELYKTGSE